jgi:hypothetical protein
MKPTKMMNPGSWSTHLVVKLLMGGILAWGAFHALGAYRLTHNPWRAVVVLAFSISFVLFWSVLLRTAGVRKQRTGRGPATASANRAEGTPP